MTGLGEKEKGRAGSGLRAVPERPRVKEGKQRRRALQGEEEEERTTAGQVLRERER